MIFQGGGPDPLSPPSGSALGLPVERLKKKFFLVIALCKCGHRKLDISINNTARSFKLGQLIEDDE